jgi:hypothetical protein
MAIEGYINTLSLFIAGNMSVSKLEKTVDDRLSELRRSPEMNPEKRILSTIGLYLHEMNEGFRDEAELYGFIRAALDETTQSKGVSRGITVHER